MMQHPMNRRFDLNSLPRCGAKTRAGTPCKRFGNLRNGRCKLHGGRSTGARTEEGKRAVRDAHTTHGETPPRKWLRFTRDARDMIALFKVAYPTDEDDGREQRSAERRVVKWLLRKFGIVIPLDD